MASHIIYNNNIKLIIMYMCIVTHFIIASFTTFTFFQPAIMTYLNGICCIKNKDSTFKSI